MKTFSPDLAAHLASGVTTLAWCWRITRTDGVVYGFTDHDRPLAFDATQFESESGLIPSEIRTGSDLAVDAQDAEGVLTSDRITETDILDGRWDNAQVEVWRVNWQDPAQRVMMRRGAIGQIRRGRLAFVAEMRSLAHVLGQTAGRSFQYACDAALGDGRCRIDLDLPDYRASGTLAGLASARVFVTSSLGAYAEGWFAGGVVEWLSGANAGRRAEVMRHELGAFDATITLLEVPVRPLAVGDTFVIRAGCDKQIATCASKFGNVANFRGFPHIPGQDAVIRYATRDGGHDGRPL